jgi:putative membrane protein
MMGYYGFGTGVFGWAFMALVWGAFIWFIVWLVSQVNRPTSTNRTAAEILGERYAKGEITKKEYDRMRSDLAD